jgi:hypothetical protein
MNNRPVTIYVIRRRDRDLLVGDCPVHFAWRLKKRSGRWPMFGRLCSPPTRRRENSSFTVHELGRFYGQSLDSSPDALQGGQATPVLGAPDQDSHARTWSTKSNTLLVPPGSDHRPAWKLPQERLGHVAAPANRRALGESFRQILRPQVPPFDGCAVRRFQKGRGMVDMAQRRDRLAAIDARLAREPLRGDFPYAMVLASLFDLAHAVLVTIAALRPARARTQFEVSAIHEFMKGSAKNSYPHRGRLVGFGTRN